MNIQTAAEKYGTAVAAYSALLEEGKQQAKQVEDLRKRQHAAREEMENAGEALLTAAAGGDQNLSAQASEPDAS